MAGLVPVVELDPSCRRRWLGRRHGPAVRAVLEVVFFRAGVGVEGFVGGGAVQCRGRRHGLGVEVDQRIERIEDRVAASAAHPALADAQLVLNDPEHRAAGGTPRGQGHAGPAAR